MKRVLLSVALGLIMMLAGCDEFPARDRLGVWRQDDQVLLRYALCPEEHVTTVEIYDAGDIARRDDDDILWRIESTAPNEVDTFEVGVVPEGFQEEVPLRQRVSGSEITAFVGTNQQTYAEVMFRPRTLETDALLASSGEFVSPSGFDEAASDSC